MPKIKKKLKFFYAKIFLLTIFSITPTYAIENNACLLKVLEQARNDSTIADLKQHCQNKIDNNKDVDEFKSALASRMANEKATQKNLFAIMPHKPIYLLPLAYNSRINTAPFDITDEHPDNTEIKFQVSFKFSVLQNVFNDQGDLYFAYTNQSYWQAYNSNASSPFRETNHEPEIFMLFDTHWQFDSIKIAKIALGVVHQSNGRRAELSRSWNRLYANFVLEYSNNLFFSIKPWWRIPEPARIDDNPDIHKFLGYSEFRAFYVMGNQKLGVMLRNNFRVSSNKSAIELNWSFPLRENLWGYVQYFNGYGESLIDYNASVNRLSIGIMLTTWL